MVRQITSSALVQASRATLSSSPLSASSGGFATQKDLLLLAARAVSRDW